MITYNYADSRTLGQHCANVFVCCFQFLFTRPIRPFEVGRGWV